jgi:fructuronate reductase
MQRLSDNTLKHASSGVLVPAYDRQAVGCGILHLGIGAFHRAHQAVYTEHAMNQRGGDWAITGVSLRSGAVARQLRPQDCLYSVLSEDGAGHSLQVIGAVKDILVATEQMQQVLSLIADPAVQIVSLTITEKGYCSSGKDLDASHPGIRADLAQPQQPTTAIGILALGLSQRRGAGELPLTIMSCDNLSENGRVLRAALYQYCQRVFPELPGWLDKNVCFPSSMVDRIVPAIEPRQRQRQCDLLGLDDSSAIATEPFIQWVVEDNFVAGRPAWEEAGVSFVEDIRPYENIKLGMLNASHSAIACIGLLADLATVDAVTTDPVTGAFIRQLMSNDLAPGLEVPARFDLDAYRLQLLERFANPRLQHRCEQIFMDSSAKISQRWLQHLQLPGKRPCLALALSAWSYLVFHSQVEIDDPAKDALLRLRSAGAGGSLQELLGLACIRPDTVSDFDALCVQVSHNMVCIGNNGIQACIENMLPDPTT